MLMAVCTGMKAETTVTFDFTGDEAYGLPLSTNDNGAAYNADPAECINGEVNITLSGRTRWWGNDSGNELRLYANSSIAISVDAGKLISRVAIEGKNLNTANLSIPNGTFADGVWTGSADTVFIYPTVSSGNVPIGSISITYEDGGGKPKPQLGFSRNEATATIGEPFTAPTLTCPESAKVAYSSSDKDVATVDQTTGMVTLVGPGTTVITARVGETEEHAAASASYNLHVVTKAGADSLSVVLKDNSEPITFTNDEDNPWTIEDGYIQNGNVKKNNSSSCLTGTFTIGKTSMFVFDKYVHRIDNSTSSNLYHYLNFNVNGKQVFSQNNQTGWSQYTMLLEPGTYTVQWIDTVSNSTNTYYSKLRKMELTSDVIDINVTTPGSLGVEVLYVVNTLGDVRLLKVSGTINSTDWANIKQMKNLVWIDLGEAKFDAVPDNAFNGLRNLIRTDLPEGATSIGEYAYRGTKINTIEIPATVRSIGRYAFAETGLKEITFAEGSQLQTIGDRAFYRCTSLTEFIMPNTVTELTSEGNNVYNSASTFEGCTSLYRLHFSDALNSINRYTCRSCTKLTDLHLPKQLIAIRNQAFYETESLRHVEFPDGVKTIEDYAFEYSGVDSVCLPVKMTNLGYRAFQYCNNLKYIELPSYIGSYDRNFEDCPAVETVVCKSATPPSISNDPFQDGASKGNMTLIVPSFAVVNYKLDTYWYQFGSILEGEDVGYWKITSALSLTNNRRMDGKPDIDLYYGGKFTVGGNAPMETAQMNFFVSETNPGLLVNDCADFTADSVNTYFNVEYSRWYFITPLHDVALDKVTHSANASFVFRYYDGAARATNGTGNSWKNVDTDTLRAGQGYIFQCNANGTITLPADAGAHPQVFATTDVTMPLSAFEATSTANAGWNYVGNPYPAYFDIYYMDFTAPITVWADNTYRAYSIVDDKYALRPMQAFFVQKPEAVDNIIFHKEGRQLSSEIVVKAASPRMAPPAGASRHLFDIAITDGTYSDQTRVVVNPNAQPGYERGCDASKFMSINADVPQVMTADADGNTYAINERPVAAGATVAMGYKAAKAGFYTISVPRADGTALLHDKLLGTTADISSNGYSFYSGATNGTDFNRFELSFEPTGQTPTAIDGTPAGTEAAVTGAEGYICVSGEAGAAVSIWAADGRTLHSGKLGTTPLRINLPAGIYVVGINGRTQKTIVY